MRNTGFIAFLSGAAMGAAVTWCCVRKKYEELAQEEIESVKEVFRKKESTGKEVQPSVSDEDADAADRKRYNDILKKEGYVNYSGNNTGERRDDAMKHKKPYVISPEQFGEEEDYDQVSLTYYADQVLADENDEIVEDVEEAIGFESLSHFGEYEDDSVFVRNDERKCDYEILLDQRMYSDVAARMPY